MSNKEKVRKMFKKVLGLVVLLICMVGLSYAIASNTNMKEGLWEITSQIEMPGIPMKMPSQTYTLCLTKKDMVPQKAEPGQECKMIKHDVKGDTLTWVMECKTPEGIAVSSGRITYKGISFDGVTKVKHTGMEMTQNMKGRWLGQCK